MVPLGIVPLRPLTGDRVNPTPLQVTVDMLLIAGADAMKTNPDSEAVPPAVVRLSAPVAPLPTTAVTTVEESTWKEATEIPPSEMAEMPPKLLPVIVMLDPVTALVGVNEMIEGVKGIGRIETLNVKFLPIQLLAIGPIEYVAV